MKKNMISLIGILVIMALTACSNKLEVSQGNTQNAQTEPEAVGAEQETMADDLPEQQGEMSQPETTAIENDAQDKAIELYVKVLRNYLSEGKTDFTVSFIDLDGDSTREMVVFFGESHADGGYLFTIKNGEAIQILSKDSDCFGQYGGFTYKEKGNVFVTENESATEAQISHQIFYYTMENGKAVCKDVTESITQFDSGESKFYVNDTEVESETFHSVAEKYGLLEMSTVSYLEGVRVMDEQMDTVYKAYNRMRTVESTDSELTSEELFDLFINGSISAVSSTDSASTFYITDLNIDSEEWDSYSVGERVDLDNDGENELVICGPYGGIYLDARDNRVYEFAAGEGNALVLSYTVYNGATWVMYSNRMHTGYEAYHMEKFEGADYLAAEMNFNEELVDEDNAEGEEKYTLNGTEISYDEYAALCSRIFAAEVSTNNH